MKKTFWAVLVIAVVSFLSMGCITTKVLESAPVEIKREISQEEVKAFLLTRKNFGSLVVYTDKYMYVIESNSPISFFMNNLESKYVRIDLKNGHYSVDEKNDVNIFLDGYVDNLADEELKKSAMNISGFYDTSTDKYKIRMHLRGKRYLIDEMNYSSYKNLNNKPHNPLILNIENTAIVDHSSADTMRKVALLPLSVPADAVAIGVGAGVAAVAVPLYLLSK